MQALVDGRRPLSLATRPTYWPVGSDIPTRLTGTFKVGEICVYICGHTLL